MQSGFCKVPLGLLEQEAILFFLKDLFFLGGASILPGLLSKIPTKPLAFSTTHQEQYHQYINNDWKPSPSPNLAFLQMR